MTTLATTLYAFSVICGILFGWFRFKDASQTSEEKEITKGWYGRVWHRIDKLGISDLPERLMRWFLSLKHFRKIISELPVLKRYGESTSNALLMVVLVTNVVFITGFLIILISVCITMAAIILGGIGIQQLDEMEWEIWYYINFFFDLLTVFFTFRLFNWALRIKKYLLLFIVLDILVAGTLAFYSLFLGLYSTPYKLNMLEVSNILFGISPDGTSWEFGSFFWAMHTTFIPTLIYLTALFLAAIGKIIIIPIARVIKKGEVVDKPHYLTATMFSFIGLVSAALATFVLWWSNWNE